jgi:hypothetical protein
MPAVNGKAFDVERCPRRFEWRRESRKYGACLLDDWRDTAENFGIGRSHAVVEVRLQGPEHAGSSNQQQGTQNSPEPEQGNARSQMRA